MESFMKAPKFFLMNLFPSSNALSSTIKWESQRGGRGMTPFSPPGSPAQVTAPHGIAEHYAEAAYWKEKMPFDEEFLNNLRKPGTTAEYQTAEAKLAKELASLSWRSDRRKEWMFAQMLFGNGFTYHVKGGYRATIDYGIPADHRVTLASAYNWNDGGSKNIMSDIQDGKKKIKNDTGGMVNVAMCNSEVLKLLANDTALRQLLQRSMFMGGPGGSNNLFEGNKHEWVGVNPGVIGSLLDIDTFYVYDEMYEIRAWLTQGVTGGSTTWFTVDDNSDFVAGETLRFWDASAGTYQDVYLLGVTYEAGTVQIDAPPASSDRAAEDYVTMQKYYIPSDKFVMMATSVDGQPIAEYMQAPYGLNRVWGQSTDRHEEWDPDVVWIRVQDKGLPILKNRDGVYVLTVQTTAAQAATSTTTTTSSSTTTTTTA
jgi:hypothetical protein